MMHNYIGTDICTGIWSRIEIQIAESVSPALFGLDSAVPSSLGSLCRFTADVSHLTLEVPCDAAYLRSTLVSGY